MVLTEINKDCNRLHCAVLISCSFPQRYLYVRENVTGVKGVNNFPNNIFVFSLDLVKFYSLIYFPEIVSNNI